MLKVPFVQELAVAAAAGASTFRASMIARSKDRNKAMLEEMTLSFVKDTQCWRHLKLELKPKIGGWRFADNFAFRDGTKPILGHKPFCNSRALKFAHDVPEVHKISRS